MGAWGTDNFENDTALDVVASVRDKATSDIIEFCATDHPQVEDLDMVLAEVAIHIALCQHCRAPAPDHTLAVILRDKVLKTYDQQIDGLSPSPDYKRQRRVTIVETLDRYEQLARSTE